MCKLRTISLLIVILSVIKVHSFPRKKLVKSLTSSDRNSRLASVLSDYWTERGFHDALTDNLMASESQGKDLMITGDDDISSSNYRAKSKIRIPRGRLAPPSIAAKHNYVSSSLKMKLNRGRQQRKRLMAVKHYRYPRYRVMNPAPVPTASRKQDMEIMESVTLIDGGTPQSDGTIMIRANPQQSERKYQQGPVIDEDQSNPLNYNLQDEDLNTPYKQQNFEDQSISQSRIPSYHTIPAPYNGYPAPNSQQSQLRQPKVNSLPSMSLNQFQQQLFQQQQQPSPQQQQPQNYPPQQLMYSTPKPQVVPIFVIPPPQKPRHQQQQQPLAQHQPQQQRPHHLPPPPPQPSPSSSPTLPPSPPPSQPAPPSYNAQLFQQQFQHPFATQPPSQLSSLAQLTASLLSGASSVAAATAAAANTLAKGELPIPTSPQQPSPPEQLQHQQSHQPQSIPFPPPSYSEIPSQHHQYGPISGGLQSAASILSASHVLLPTTPPPDLPPTPQRPGVIPNTAEQLDPTPLVDQPETLANQITKLVETGRKILYFPKGVIDTMDVLLKQMERNPMVAYWGDKFFAKVFGDTSGT